MDLPYLSDGPLWKVSWCLLFCWQLKLCSDQQTYHTSNSSNTLMCLNPFSFGDHLDFGTDAMITFLGITELLFIQEYFQVVQVVACL